MLNLFWISTPYTYFTHYLTTINYANSSAFVLFTLIILTVLIISVISSTKVFGPHHFLVLVIIPQQVLFFKTPNINLGLINALSFWHPVLLIIIIVLGLKYVYNTSYNAYSLTLVSGVFVVLGSWWAGQELLWMGWWNWDGVENSLLLLFVIFFLTSHITKNYYSTATYKYNIIGFFILYFFIVNKTNLYKSIHSFTNSTANNYSHLLLIYPVLGFLITQYALRLRLLFTYHLLLWVIYFTYFFATFSNIFSKLSFFFVFNCVFWYLILLFINPIVVCFIPFLQDATSIVSFVVTCVFLANNLIRIKLHRTILFVFLFLLLRLGFKSYIFWPISGNYLNSVYNVTQLNRICAVSNLNLSKLLEITYCLKLVYKNSLLTSGFNYKEIPTALLLPLKQVTFNSNTSALIYFFLVTLIIYSKQKLKYKYYI